VGRPSGTDRAPGCWHQQSPSHPQVQSPTDSVAGVMSAMGMYPTKSFPMTPPHHREANAADEHPSRPKRSLLRLRKAGMGRALMWSIGG
jgi:hypothetical protein